VQGHEQYPEGWTDQTITDERSDGRQILGIASSER
jgi:hypothetical protein